MNILRLIVDRKKRPDGYNCAIDIEVDELPVAITDDMSKHIPNLCYLGGLTYDQADFIMRDLGRLLSGYDVKATVTDHTQRKTQVCLFN